MVENLYKAADDGVRYAVETAFLEHVFEWAGPAEYFSDWLQDAELSGAYERALQWGVEHRTPDPA